VTHAPFVLHDYVRWADVDPAGIIRYDAYTRFYELAESELFRAVGLPYHAIFRRFGIGIPRRVLHMEFVSPPVLDEHLEVRTYISEVGRTSMRMHFDVYGHDGALRSAGYLVLVCVEAGSAPIRKRPWPEEFLRLLEPFRMSVDDARSQRMTGA
jgi:YbgC/YbaW family acyl-CoA thioester hydrolase